MDQRAKNFPTTRGRHRPLWFAMPLLAGILVIGCGTTPSSTASAAPKNLVTGGDFESGKAPWEYVAPEAILIQDPSRDSTVLVLNANDLDHEVDAVCRPFGVKPDTDYTLECWVKQFPGPGKYKVTIDWMDANRRHLTYDNDWAGNDRPNDFQRETVIVHAPARARYAKVFLGVGPGAKCAFDGLAVIEAVPTTASPVVQAEVVTSTKVLLEMVPIPMVKFPLFEKFKNGGPPAMVQTVDSFLIGKYEVTQEQFQAVMGYNNSRFEGPQRPKDQASWYEALVFCNLLSQSEGLEPVYSVGGTTDTKKWGTLPLGKEQASGPWRQITCRWEKNGYRLPTEMEWRAAALGGYTGPSIGESGFLIEFAGDPRPNVAGDSEDSFGWYKKNAMDVGEADPNFGTHPVGTKAPNPYGLYDLAGNVFEWCWDGVTGNGYHLRDETNYRGPETGNGQRIRAGGSWAYDPYFAANGGQDPWLQAGDSGFRIARTGTK